VSTTVIWALVGLGLLALAARRRSVSGAVVALQSVVLAAEALRIGATEDAALLLVGSVLLAKAAVIGALLWVAVARSRHARPLGDDVAGITRIGSAVVVALLAAVLLPSAGLDPPAAADGAAALVAIGLAMLLTRRAAAFGLLALLVAENGIVVAGLGVAGGLPIVVELGIAFDAILVISVAVVFHGRIQSAFGTTDTSVLSALRD
jgi:hydrogenase-4 component E